VPLTQIARMLEADEATLAATVEQIDARLRAEIERLEASRRQVRRLAAGDSLVLPPEIVAYLDRLREIGASERMLAGERDGWILVSARWPDKVLEWIPAKLAQLEDPRLVRLYQVLSQLLETEGIDDRLANQAADIMADLADQAEAAGELDYGAEGRDEMSIALLDDLADAADKRAERLRELMRERGWDGWTRMQRVAKPPG
jgi:hypothetical protein